MSVCRRWLCVFLLIIFASAVISLSESLFFCLMNSPLTPHLSVASTPEQRSFVNLSSRAPNAASCSTVVAHCDHKMSAFSYVKPRALVFRGVLMFSEGTLVQFCSSSFKQQGALDCGGASLLQVDAHRSEVSAGRFSGSFF